MSTITFVFFIISVEVLVIPHLSTYIYFPIAISIAFVFTCLNVLCYVTAACTYHHRSSYVCSVGTEVPPSHISIYIFFGFTIRNLGYVTEERMEHYSVKLQAVGSHPYFVFNS
jgi:hypothetical protein